jgi:hypothetical protein
MQVYGRQGAQPVTAEVVSASIATTPAGEVPVMLRPWGNAAVPVTLYPSRCVGRDYVGPDCLLAPEGDQAAPDAAPVLSVLPPDYLTSNAAYLEDLAEYAMAEGRTQQEAAAFARWVIASETMTFGVYDWAYERWVRSLTCTMTAAYAVLTYSRMNGAALRLECGCGQRHPGWPWEATTLWNDEERHYRSADTVPQDRTAELIAARGYRVTGDWSNGDVVRRVPVERLPGPESGAAPDAEPSDPGTAEAWESDGGACPGVTPPRGPEPGPTATPRPQEPTGDAPAAPPAAPSAEEVAKLPTNGRRLVEAATANGWDVTVTSGVMQGGHVQAVEVSGAYPVRTGTQHFTARCVWDGARYWASASQQGGRHGAAFREVLAWVRDTRAINRADEEAGRTVWGRDAAESGTASSPMPSPRLPRQRPKPGTSTAR